MSHVNKRGGFSDRNGIKPINSEIQLYEFDERTRVQLKNLMDQLYLVVYEKNTYMGNSYIQDFSKYVLGVVYSEPLEVGKNYSGEYVMDKVGETILEDDYDDVLTVIEAIIQFWDDYLKNSKKINYYDVYGKRYFGHSIFDIVNDCFQKEYIGYRFIDKIVVPVSDDYEVSTILEALRTEEDAVYTHISKANKYLSDRDKPDYENSIKESISAVEAYCEIITGKKGKEATLANMLKKLEDNGVSIHGGLKNAFVNLYGYTSDAKGIRHAGNIDGASSTFAEAKYMLVSCCAFINYLKIVTTK